MPRPSPVRGPARPGARDTSRRRPAGLLAALGVLVAIAAVAGCGKKGPPQAPLVIVPGPVRDVSAERIGDRAVLRFALPEKNTDNSTPADLARVDVFALSVDDAASAPEAGVVARDGVRVGSVDIGRPASGDKADEPAGPRIFSETLTAEAMKMWRPKTVTRASSTAPSDSAASAPAGSPAGASATPEKTAGAKAVSKPLPVRVYALVPVSGKGRRGPAMLANVALGPAPEAPAPPALTYTETAITAIWLASEKVGGYNVYDATPPAPSAKGPAAAPASPAPLNDALLKEPKFEDKRVEFGKARCYAVSAVEVVDSKRIESLPSAPACVTPVDTFPPSAPTGVAAVAGPGSISLIWDAVNSADLAGYVVLRGVAPGDTLQTLTPEPIKETTFRDPTVTPGTRYVYAIVAVDTAKNASAPSAKVEETAR